MEIVDFGNDPGTPITEWGSVGATRAPLAHGEGEAHVTVVHIAAGGELGPHPAGYAQLWVIVSGSGWVREADGPKIDVTPGEAVHIPRGTVHSKGAHGEGLCALVVQVTDLYRAQP